MTEKTIEVGGVAAWKHVRDGMLVRTHDSAYALRMRGRGVFVGMPGEPWLPAHPWDDAGKWRWGSIERPGSTATPNDQVTIVALDVPADATADDLRELAEKFDIREAVDAMLMCEHCGNTEPSIELLDDGTCSQPWCTECDSEMGAPFDEEDVDQLHRAGWRPNMTIEDAARMLAEAA